MSDTTTATGVSGGGSAGGSGGGAYGDPDEHHDEHHVHTYEASGIQEGNARVPRWLLVVILALFSFFAGSVVPPWGAQPSTARAKAR